MVMRDLEVDERRVVLLLLFVVVVVVSPALFGPCGHLAERRT